MTSLELFPPSVHEPRVPPVWGTGKGHDEKYNIWTPKPPTWQYSGKPVEQDYTLTSLKLSNLRLNDQLIPNPQHFDVRQVMIDLPFPSEHPYSSHIPRKEVFPNFDSPDDPKTGTEARQVKPKNRHIPAQPYDVLIVHKTKGSGLRHEIQALPSESLKKPLHWNENQFDHLLKYPGSSKQNFYPTPPTLLDPNHDNRSDGSCFRGNMSISKHTADTLKNLERDQWTTTYDRAHTGLGPSNPYELDNYQEKISRDDDDDTLYSKTKPVFDPARPMEGRINRGLVPPPPPQTSQFPEHQKDPYYMRKATLTEKEENRLWNGKEYVNLPEGYTEDPQAGFHSAQGLATLAEHQARGQPHPVPYKPAGAPQPEDDGYIEKLAQQQHDDFQQIEASNRWKLLEAQQPHHNAQARQHKMNLVSSKEQPAVHVFYKHEGQFQRERAGLYKTTYDPYALQHSMNKEEEAGSRIMDFSDYHKNSLDLPTALNQDMADIIRYNRTLGNPGSVAQLNDQPSQFEAIGPFDKAKSLQKAQLQPSAQTADVRTQEGELVLKESTFGDSYNTKKFLQENSLPMHARNEPLQLMSKDNQDVSKIRLTTFPASTSDLPPKFPEDVLTGDPLPGGNWLAKSYDCSLSRPNTAPEFGLNLSDRYSYSSNNLMTKSATNPLRGLPDLPVSLEMGRIASRYGAEDQRLSRSTNITPNLRHSWAGGSAYQSQFASSLKPLTDLSFKNDDRFSWKPGHGTPRPQTTLLRIQDSFSPSEARNKFHQQFPESGVDIRENIIQGKRHTFNGINAQVLRGAPIVD